jgi:flavin-dependent dehydrogenase
VIGGGPAGSFFSYFLLDLAERTGVDVQVDIYEPREFSRPGPAGCNHCGGIVSESLVQSLAAEGINLTTEVVQRGIDSYMLHTDEGCVRIETPLQEKRIAAVFRGSGPRGSERAMWASFDAYLQALTVERGAQVIRERVDAVSWDSGRPQIKTREGSPQTYDLAVAAIGVNTRALNLLEGLGFGYRPPLTTKTYICEIPMSHETMERCLGSSMHVFLLNMDRLEFAALIPKGEHVTMCLLGEGIDDALVQSFVETPVVKRCLPPDCRLERGLCHCAPQLNIRGAAQLFADRVVLIGDCGVTRLYKDGIGAAYRTAKAAATTAILHGISAEDFRRHTWPVCRAIGADNTLGKVVFGVTRQIQRRRFARRGVLSMVAREQRREGRRRRMSLALWDMFTGSAPYREVFLRTLHPFFLGRLLWEMAISIRPLRGGGQSEESAVKMGALGKVHTDGEVIIREGETGDCMYVIQEGEVEVLITREGKEVRLAVLGEREFFGEMALFERVARFATVRALGEVRVLTVDKRALLRRIQEDPSMAFHIVEKMSHRIREMDAELARIKGGAQTTAGESTEATASD